MYRLFEVVLGIILIIITSPVILFFAILVHLTSSGGPFYKQERSGLNGKRFFIYKIRSMIDGAENIGPAFTRSNDPRITALGGFIRRTKIDEFPQLLNVIKGEMSFIGPRPKNLFFVKKIPDLLRLTILSIKPGIIGPAQLFGLVSSNGADSSIRGGLFYIQCLAEYDYAKNKGLLVDCYIFCITFQLLTKRYFSEGVIMVEKIARFARDCFEAFLKALGDFLKSRCPKCDMPVESGAKRCSSCGEDLMRREDCFNL